MARVIGRREWLWVLANGVAVLGSLGFAALSAGHLPSRYPIHFQINKNPDRWTSGAGIEWFFIPAFAALLALFLSGLALLLPKIPARLWNLPHKERWLQMSAEQRRPVIRTMIQMVLILALLDTLTLTGIQLAVFRSAWSRTVPTLWPAMVLVGCVYIGVIVGSVMRASRLIQEPGGK